jgi:hypothetical protein
MHQARTYGRYRMCVCATHVCFYRTRPQLMGDSLLLHGAQGTQLDYLLSRSGNISADNRHVQFFSHRGALDLLVHDGPCMRMNREITVREQNCLPIFPRVHAWDAMA